MIDNKKIKIDLINDLSDIVRNDINEMGYDTSSVSKDKLLLLYNELLMRLIIPRKREIEISKEFVCPTSLQDGFNELKQKILNGISINAHLSRKIKNIDYDDKMFYDWRIHHFHLGTEIDPTTNLIKGTKEVAFAYITDEKAYFIQVLDHNQWGNKDVLNIIESNWPFLLYRYKVNGEPEIDLSQDDILKLRGKNVNTILKLASGNSYVAIGGGYNGLGSSLEALQATIELKKIMEKNEKEIYDKILNGGISTKCICKMKRINQNKLSISDESNNILGDISWKNLISIYGHL